MILDLAVLQKHTTLETDTVANNDVGSDNHIRTNTAILANLRGRVDHNIAAEYVRLGMRSKLLGVALGE